MHNKQLTLPSSLFGSSHLQTTQLPPEQAPTFLESPADEATPVRLGTPKPKHVNVCLQLPQCWSQSSREVVPWGHSTFNLPNRVSSSAPPREMSFFLLHSEDHPKCRRIPCQESWRPCLQIQNRQNPAPGSTWTPGPNV
jgi:hypothetical protein